MYIYRTRLSWSRLEHSMRHDSGPIAAATQAFLRWYFPRFLAKTFALARQDEFEADRIAGKILSRDVAGAALTEIAIKGNWIAQEFWARHWRGAALSEQPVGPYALLRKLLALAPDDEFARESLRQTLKQISGVDDTHPVLRDRLEALKVGSALPIWSGRSALELLGSSSKWLKHFDRQWCLDNAKNWQQHHAYLGRVGACIEALTASAGRNSADEMAELGNLKRRLDPQADVRACYERALQIAPGHGAGLRGLVQCLPPTERDLRLDCLGQLYEHSVAYRWWACRIAVGELEQHTADGTRDEKTLNVWRERLQQADEAEARALEELCEPPFFQSIAQHDLNDFELGEFQSDIARCQPVTRAWLVRKSLREFAHRRCYILFIELPSLDDEERSSLCRQLENSLDLPGQVLALWAGESPTLADIERQAFAALYVRSR